MMTSRSPCSKRPSAGCPGHHRQRRVQPPRPGRRPRVARRDRAPGLRPLPAPDQERLQPGLHGAHARRPSRRRPAARRAVPRSPEPRRERPRRRRIGHPSTSPPPSWTASTRCRASTRTGSCATTSTWSRRPCAPTSTSRRATVGPRTTSRSSSTPPSSPISPSPVPPPRSSSTPPAVEGVHLRGGKVARGGIRWSDRHDDFRTEMLGLMKAQTVKNVGHHPRGGQGRVRRQAAARRPRSRRPAEVVACYRTFIRGLLDLTDNLVDDPSWHPPTSSAMTATIPTWWWRQTRARPRSPTLANGISAEYGFWLGDAFASGGSAGYDHKAIGITARGAWESVRCHFRQLGIDADAEELTVVGIGDMSGDVFGNGMLRSRHLKVVAAFDHRHIFIDPDPGPGALLPGARAPLRPAPVELGRLRPDLISDGGGDLSAASARSIPLSAPLQALLGVEVDALTPTSWSRRCCGRPSTCSGTAGSARSSRPRAESARGRRGPRQRPDPRRCLRDAAAGWRARAGTWDGPSGPASSSPGAAASSTPTPSTTPPGSTARTTRSTSSWRSTPRWGPA